MLVVAAQAAARSSGAGAGHSEGAKVCSTWCRAEICSWLMLADTRGHVLSCCHGNVTSPNWMKCQHQVELATFGTEQYAT